MQGELDFCQRWRVRRDSYRPAGEPIDTRRYEVGAIDGDGSDTIARGFVVEHHYSASYPSARFRFGLYRGGQLVGVAVFSTPVHKAVIEKTLGVPLADGAELGRFVLLDDVEGNGETWFLARCFEQLRRRGLAGVVSHSDPMPRTTADGTVKFGGHVGTIYQAGNGVYLGRATPRTLHVLPDGTVFNDRAAQKIRARERGWRYAVAQLVAAGAPEPTGDVRRWLVDSLAKVTRPLRHAGNHRYAWGFAPAVRRRLVPVGRYPKLIQAPPRG